MQKTDRELLQAALFLIESGSRGGEAHDITEEIRARLAGHEAVGRLDATVKNLYAEHDGFTPDELQLMYTAWKALIEGRRNSLSQAAIDWLNAWSLWDLICSPMDDNARRFIRYGHYLGWWANQERHNSRIPATQDMYERLAEPEDEPVAWASTYGRVYLSYIVARHSSRGKEPIPLYRHPRQPVRLSDEEIENLFEENTICKSPRIAIARAIEKAVLDKNQ